MKMGTPNISAGVAAKTKYRQSAVVTSKFLKSITGGKISSLTDMHWDALRLTVMWFYFK